MEIKDTTVLKDVDEFIRQMNKAMDTEAIIFHAFVLTCPAPNLSIILAFEGQRFDVLRSELSSIVDKSYMKCKNEMWIEYNEVHYGFKRLK